MKNKRLFKQTVIITALSLSISACLSGCGGKQEEEVEAKTVEEVTEVESSTENGYPIDAVMGQGLDEVIIDTTTATTEEDNTDTDNLGVDGVTGDNEYDEMKNKETDIGVSIDTDSKIIVIDGEEYINVGGDDLTEDEIKALLGDDYVPPKGDTTGTTGGTTGGTYIDPDTGIPSNPKQGSGNDDQGPAFGSSTLPDSLKGPLNYN